MKIFFIVHLVKPDKNKRNIYIYIYIYIYIPLQTIMEILMIGKIDNRRKQ